MFKYVVFVVTAVVFFMFVSLSFATDTVVTTDLRYPLSVTGPVAPEVESPYSQDEKVAAIGKAVQFLLETQNKDGSWGNVARTKRLNIYAPQPGGWRSYRAGTTALALAALLEVEVKLHDKKSEITVQKLDINRLEFTEAIDRAEEWLLEFLPKERRVSNDVIYNVWGHAYGIRAATRMMTRFPDDTARIEKLKTLIKDQVSLLERYELLDGGWGYYDFEVGSQKSGGSPSSFTTATVLLALDDARNSGFDIPQKIVDRAMDSLLRQRRGDFSYCYGEYLKMAPMRGINTPPGSLGRSQSCNLAMKVWDDPDMNSEVFRNWLDRLFARNEWFGDGRKKPVPHEHFFQIAGYFYYYAHFYGAFCIEQVPEPQQKKFRDLMAATLIPLQETDGSFWDYPLYDFHQQYGTGYTIMALLRSLD